MTFPESDPENIVKNFAFSGTFASFERVTTGHINDSYHIRCSESGHPGYFLQRINTGIFKDAEALMANISLVTSHITNKIKQNGALSYRVPQLIAACDGKMFYKAANGDCWRMTEYLGGMHSYDVVENTGIAFEGGKAFGTFISVLSDMPAGLLNETIPDFHNMETRLGAYNITLQHVAAARAGDAANEISFVKERAPEMLRFHSKIKSGEIPVRITHNDTKFNNILFDSSEHAVAVIDLDTVMPGSVMFDFGDAIRTGANTAAEDEQNLGKVTLNLPVYEAYAKGFLQSLRSTLTGSETDNLAFSARYMTFIIGLRFLTDYLQGDRYFKTQYASHNLVRARVQFRLVQRMEENERQMQQVIEKLLNH